MADKDWTAPQAQPATKPKPMTATQTPLQVQCFTHKGEVVVTFNQPIGQWFLPPETAREFARIFTEAAAVLDAQEAGRSTKQ